MQTGERCRVDGLKVIGKGEIILGNDVIIGDDVTFDVTERLVIGDRTIISDHCVIAGRDIEIGKEFWMGQYAQIGGGSAKDKPSKLKIGDLCHLGRFGSINTSRAISVGDEVGLGEGTKLYSHGAWLNWLDGFPCQWGEINIEDNVWVPNAIITPNVRIGHDSVISAMSLVNKNIPSGSLAGGVPCEIIKNNYYPREMGYTEYENKIKFFIEHFKNDIIGSNIELKLNIDDKKIYVDECLTLFDLKNKIIDGKATEITEKFRQELRRFGFRFRYYNDGASYKKW